MTCSNEAARLSAAQRNDICYALDNVDTRLYYLKHLCAMMSHVAAASGPGAQASEIQAENVHAVFGWFADQLAEITDDMQPLRAAVTGCAP